MKKVILFSAALFVVITANSQNIGVGNPLPETKLHVVDTVNTSDGTNGAFITVHNATTSSPIGVMSGIRFRLDGVNAGLNSRFKGGIFFQKTSSFGVGSLLFATNGVGDNSSATAADAHMAITSLGRVGIGTITPAAPLHISTTAGEVLRIQGNNPYATLNDNTDGYRSYWWYNGTDVLLGTASASNAALKFTSNGTIRGQFTADGRMVIGSGSSLPATGYLLSVDGKIISEELKIQLSTSWPDYVFKNDYKLLSLPELEQSIKQQQHLPNIPSASEVEKDGIFVGDMNKRLLEKVEELTLYLIDLNKKNTQLTEEVKLLKQEVQAIKH